MDTNGDKERTIATTADEVDGGTSDASASEAGATPTPPLRSLGPAIRASLNAKLERLLDRPLIARVIEPPRPVEEAAARSGLPEVFCALQKTALASPPTAGEARHKGAWQLHPEDGTYHVRVAIDYAGLWRGCEKEVVETVNNAVESPVTFLTDEQKLLLERSPREFLALQPRPESAELVSFEKENVGGSVRVVGLRLSAAPESCASVHHLAVVSNLVQIERQLAGLQTIASAGDDGPLAPLRVLLGMADASCLPKPPAAEPATDRDEPLPGDRFDECQRACIRQALATPHFAVVQGPPGSGKTTVITSIIRQELARGGHVLVVSPTHVAVDNLVERLAPRPDDDADDVLETRSLPVRYCARVKKLSARAQDYWVGSKQQRRSVTIAQRVRQRLARTVPFAEALFAREGEAKAAGGPLSTAVSGVESVICGTPIGILSFETVKNAAPGSFDLLIVDEVSKMTLPEFLAVAVKARRWVLVGDPEQLPPYNNSEENATTLDDVLPPLLELACSVGAVLERARPAVRRNERMVVISSDPASAVATIRAHLAAVMPENVPPVALLAEATEPGIVVCAPEETDRACEYLCPVRECD